MTLDLLSSLSDCSFPMPSANWILSFPVIKQATFATSTHGATTSSLDLASSISHPGGEIAALAPRLGDVDCHPHPDFIAVGRVRQWCLDCPASEIAGD
jgi:hypothetical protein